MQSWTEGRKLNEFLLANEAFLSKTYIVKLEKGLFKISYDVIEDQNTERYALRLSFAPSPYPPLHERKGLPNSGRDNEVLGMEGIWQSKIDVSNSDRFRRRFYSNFKLAAGT
jgi:hypothetical protein